MSSATSLRPFRSVRGRLIVTDLDGAVTTWLEKGLLTCTATLNLNQPCTIEGDLRSGDPAVNNIFPADGDPLVAQSNRLVYLLLNLAPLDEARENRWQCAASGVLMSPEDQADSDIGTTHFTAYDAWQYMMGRPCYEDQMGTPIRQAGFEFAGVPGNEIAYQLIQNTVQSEGLGVYADVPPSYGGTVYWAGTNETTPALDFIVQQGTTLGQALQNLASTGNDVQGTSQCIDIIFEPIYDWEFRPGYLAQISVYNLAGVVQPKPVMGWARFNRSATTADRQHDGTPGSFINWAQFVAGQGGDAALVTPETDATSIGKYNEYASQQFFPAQPFATVTQNLAVQAITLYKQGKRTFTVDPDPMRAAIPIRDYNIGDRIFIASPPGQRVGASGYQRVQTIPIVVGPDGVVAVSQLLTSPDWPGDEVT